MRILILSQNICAFKPNLPKKSIGLCPLEINSVKSIQGDLTDEGCPCSNTYGPTSEDIAKATDDDLNTVYVNKWSIGSGLKLHQ